MAIEIKLEVDIEAVQRAMSSPAAERVIRNALGHAGQLGVNHYPFSCPDCGCAAEARATGHVEVITASKASDTVREIPPQHLMSSTVARQHESFAAEFAAYRAKYAQPERTCFDCAKPIPPGHGWQHSVCHMDDSMHEAWSAIVTCGQDRCVAPDPLDATTDGHTLGWLLKVDAMANRDGMEAVVVRSYFTDGQRAAVAMHRSAELRAKVAASNAADREREARRVLVDLEDE